MSPLQRLLYERGLRLLGGCLQLFALQSSSLLVCQVLLFVLSGESSASCSLGPVRSRARKKLRRIAVRMLLSLENSKEVAKDALTQEGESCNNSQYRDEKKEKENRRPREGGR